MYDPDVSASESDHETVPGLFTTQGVVPGLTTTHGVGSRNDDEQTCSWFGQIAQPQFGHIFTLAPIFFTLSLLPPVVYAPRAGICAR